jgi:hypothetical protein
MVAKKRYARATRGKPSRPDGLTIAFVLVFLVFTVLFFPDLATSDCINLGRSTSHYIQGAHTVIFYEGMRPVASLEVPYCSIGRESVIRLTKSYVCDNDNIMIDDDVCSIMTVSSSSARGY